MSDRKRIVKRLDDVFSKYIRARDGRCVVCWSKENLQCGHYLSRKNYSTRWDEVNANAQCGGCNIKHNQNPEPYRRYLIFRRGPRELEALEERFRQIRKFPSFELERMIEEYRKKLKEMEL